jgi:exodeoxyribonuclease V gamma subunit
VFTVYHSNQLESLKILLVHLINSEPLDHPFTPEQILVQSPGMSQWLKMALAEQLGVAANISFPLPATFIWDMFTQVLPDVPKRSAFNKESMTWKLLNLLPSHLELPEFSPLKHYLEHQPSPLKAYQLAEKIADIFDGYLVYRPEWIACWERDLPVPELSEEQPWQPILWRALCEDTAKLGQSPYHRANLYHAFIEKLAGGDFSREHFPQRLFIFGISSLPPRYIDALKAMGEHIDVHLMLANPCQHYWGEIRDRRYLTRIDSQRRKRLQLAEQGLQWQESVSPLKGSVEDNLDDEFHTEMAVGNSLLASMGKLGRDNLYLLSQSDHEEHQFFIDIPRDSLLHHIQADILHLEEHQNDQRPASSEHKQPVTHADRSLTLHACHSPMREVEVLHDQLLAMFDADADLKPRDIIVMVADINAYSASIQAVFGNAPGDRYIPYSISDRSAEHESPILTAFASLVNLPNTRCLASELLDLLETPHVLKRFDLNQDEFLQAKLWVEEAGIRWGLNKETANELDLPDAELNSWQFGITRMLTGYAMPAESDYVVLPSGAVAPYNEVQGIGANLAGKLAHFVEKIALYRDRLALTQPVESWRSVLNQLLDDFFATDLDSEIAFKSIRDTLSRLKEQLSDAQYQQDLPAAVMIQYLKDKLSNSRVSQRFLAGQVNFCTLMPMRSIPFKVVCLLGMNDGVYPRSVPKDGFDLMIGRVCAGDRSRRDDDRYLFLEALISAKNTLYISYIGQSIQDNSQREPSVLVAELMEYCQQNYCLTGEHHLAADESGERLLAAIKVTHSMVPFSANSFNATNMSSASYASEWLPVAQRLAVVGGEFYRPLQAEVEWSLLELELTELQKFWRLPVRYFFNHRLKVYFESTQSAIYDDEPFALDNLDNYQLREQLVELLLQHDRSAASTKDLAIQQFSTRLRAQGKLPVGAFADIEMQSSLAEAEDLAGKIAFLCHTPLEDSEVDIMLSLTIAPPLATTQLTVAAKNVRLVGWLTQRYQSGLVRYRCGKIRAQDYLSAWIDHLLMAVTAESCPTHLIGYDRKQGATQLIYAPISDISQAKAWLSELVEWYYKGITEPFAYFPKTALAGIEANIKKGEWIEDRDKSHSKMADAFTGGYFANGEGDDPYIARIWPQWNENLAQQIERISALVLQAPLLAAQSSDEMSKS